jgi:hypothetical protein
MNIVSGAITYEFKADIGDLRTKVDQVRKQFQLTSAQAQSASREMTAGFRSAAKDVDVMSSSVGRASSVLRSFATGFGVAGIAVAFASLSNAAADYTKRLQTMADVAKRTRQDVAAVSGLVSAGGREGVDAKTITSGLDSLGAQANKEFREGEGELTKLLEANNRKITDRAGHLKSTNDLLLDAAALIRDANTEYDKIDIAKAFGLTEEWVKLLEKGPEHLRETQRAAQEAGGAFDRELAGKAQAFADAWNGAWQDFTNAAKSSIEQAAGWLGGLIQQARSWRDSLSPELQMALGIGGAGNRLSDTGSGEVTPVGNEIVIRPRPYGGPDEGQRGRFFRNFNKPSVVPNPSRGGGGSRGGSGAGSDAVERYMQQLERSVELAKAEYDTFAQTTAERQRALNLINAEMAAKREGRALTEQEKNLIAEKSNEQSRYNDLLDQARERQSAMNQLGNTFAAALDDWIVQGGKFKDVLANLARSLASMALQASLTGGGPLGGFLGMAGKGGGLGGLFGAIAGNLFRAEGGSVTGGRGYVVGERGPEYFVPGTSGSIIPNNRMNTGGKGGGVVIHQTFTGDTNPLLLAQQASQIKAETMGAVRQAILRGRL